MFRGCKWDLAKRVRPVYVIYQCFLSEISFCYDVYGQVSLWKMPLMSRNALKECEMYSPLLSACNYFILQENRFSIRHLNLMKHKRTSDFCLRGNNQQN